MAAKDGFHTANSLQKKLYPGKGDQLWLLYLCKELLAI